MLCEDVMRIGSFQTRKQIGHSTKPGGDKKQTPLSNGATRFFFSSRSTCLTLYTHDRQAYRSLLCSRSALSMHFLSSTVQSPQHESDAPFPIFSGFGVLLVLFRSFFFRKLGTQTNHSPVVLLIFSTPICCSQSDESLFSSPSVSFCNPFCVCF